MSTIDERSKSVIERIHAAFRDAALAVEDPILVESASAELDTAKALEMLRRRPWVDLPHRFIIENSGLAAFLTPAAFRYFLPAFMVTAIALYDDAGTLPGDLVTSLTPPAAAQSFTLPESTKVPGLAQTLEAARTLAQSVPPDVMKEWFEQRMVGFSAAQHDAIREFLRYLEAHYSEDFPVFGPREALEAYWGHA